jgi:hypothetical protein
MTFEEVKKHLKQLSPLLIVDCVLELEPGKPIKTLKNVAGNEIQFLGHFAEFAVSDCLIEQKSPPDVLPAEASSSVSLRGTCPSD